MVSLHVFITLFYFLEYDIIFGEYITCNFPFIETVNENVTGPYKSNLPLPLIF